MPRGFGRGFGRGFERGKAMRFGEAFFEGGVADEPELFRPSGGPSQIQGCSKLFFHLSNLIASQRRMPATVRTVGLRDSYQFD